MKTLIRIVLCATLALGTPSLYASETAAKTSVISNTNTSAQLSGKEAEALINRLHEIHKMDRKAMNTEQKQTLRDEVISIREKLSDPLGGGVYLSAGALLLIVILLIILL